MNQYQFLADVGHILLGVAIGILFAVTILSTVKQQNKHSVWQNKSK